MSETGSVSCSLGASNKEAIGSLKTSDERQWRAIDSMRNRPPVWVTVIIGILMMIIGLLGSAVFRGKEKPVIDYKKVDTTKTVIAAGKNLD